MAPGNNSDDDYYSDHGHDSSGYSGDVSGNSQSGHSSDGSGGHSPPRYPSQSGPYAGVTFSSVPHSYVPQPPPMPQYNYHVPPTSHVPGVGDGYVSHVSDGYATAPSYVQPTHKQKHQTVRPDKKDVHKAEKKARYSHSTRKSSAKYIVDDGQGLRSSRGGGGGAGDSLKQSSPSQARRAKTFNDTSQGQVHLAKGNKVPQFYESLHERAGHPSTRLDVYPPQQMLSQIHPDQYDTRSTDDSAEGARIPAAYNTPNDIPVEHMLQRLDINQPAAASELAAGRPLPPQILDSVRGQYPVDSQRRSNNRVQDDMRDNFGQPRVGHSSSSGVRTSSSDEAQRRPGHERTAHSDMEYAQPLAHQYVYRR